MKRRSFLKTTAVTSAGLMVIPSGKVFGANEKLNIALIGAWGRARAHHGFIKKENCVAICDINDKNMEQAAKAFPNAKKYHDWRKCLDQKDIDSVVCCTLDHTHAFVANWALNRDYHIYCEKPLANSVEEARVVRANYLKRKDKVATQVGTQRHAISNFQRVKELVRDGAIGELKVAWAWGNRQLRRPGYLKGEGEPPAHIKYDLWIGPSPMHPYNPKYFSGRPGANCLNWNMYWDFGTGQVGDMGSHTMDLAWNALDADLPISAEADPKSDKFNPEVSPVGMHTSWEIPKNDWRPQVNLHWYQGGMMPNSPTKWVDLKKIGHGAMFKGSEGFIIADFGARLISPYGKVADMTYYKPRPKDQLIPPLGSFQGQWVNAAKGDKKTTCNFDYNGKMMETMMLGLVAYRVGPGKKISYDGATGKSGDDKANADLLMKRKYREGWKLDG